MQQQVSIEVAAAVERIWEILVDIDRWPEWADSVTSARRLDDGPLRVGSRAELTQPKVPKSVYTVTELAPGRAFTWEQAGPGARTTARHELAAGPDGTTRVTLSVEQSGWLGRLVGRFYVGLTARYLALESTGLKARAEAAEA